MATRARLASFWGVGASALILAAVSGGCSILLHADPDQCSTTADCAARGALFAGFTCVQGSCIAPAEAAPQCTMASECASRGSGYTCSQGMCVLELTTLDGGTDAPPSCSKDTDCQPTDPNHTEVACDPDSHICLQLTSDECPYVLPTNYSGGVAPPIYVGAFIDVPTEGAPLTHPSTLNYSLALNEFITNGGIPAGPSATSSLRVPVAIACSVSANLDNAMTHLINDVHVHGVVAPLAAADLSHVFSTYGAPDDIFIINPFSADPTLTSLQTNGLLWHMLGQPADNAVAYAAFLPVLEQYIRNNPPWSLGPTAPMKVATVTANATATNDLAGAVENVLTWNGGASSTSDSTNYQAFGISDSTLNGTPLDGTTQASTDLLASIQAAANDVPAFAPQVIISFASEEFTNFVENLEIDWQAGVPPPFYLLGPYNMGSTPMQNEVQNLSGTNRRVAGIGVASTTDMSIIDQYNFRMQRAYGTTVDVNEENYYDAMYFLIYSLIAAGRSFPNGMSGADYARGMTHLISLSSMPYDVGPADMGSIFAALGANGTIQLVGTLGPPNFDVTTGSRIGEGDVYCLAQSTADAGPPYVFAYDVLRLANPDGGPAADGGGALQGTFSCFPGLQ